MYDSTNSTDQADAVIAEPGAAGEPGSGGLISRLSSALPLLVPAALLVYGIFDWQMLGFGDEAGAGLGIAIAALLVLPFGFLAMRDRKARHEVANALHALAEGRSDDALRAAVPAEIGESITAVVGTLDDSRESVRAAAHEIGNLAEQIGAWSDQQMSVAAGHEGGNADVATAISEMVQAVEEVARNAASAAAATHEATQEAKKGQVTMTDAMGAMDLLGGQIGDASDAIRRLSKESENIGAVLDVIRGIAEQTNLLALNAAIEAARAGEQGRGFAVVADEVRTLASRTQKSTQEIQGMIESLQEGSRRVVEVMGEGDSQAKVSEELIENACVSLAEISGGISTIDSMNTQIASAAEEQHAVVQAIREMMIDADPADDGVVQAAREVQGAALRLQELASDLTARA